MIKITWLTFNYARLYSFAGSLKHESAYSVSSVQSVPKNIDQPYLTDKSSLTKNENQIGIFR